MEIKDNAKIRKEFSSKASNSFVKCKKKLEVEAIKGNAEQNIYIGKKSLWHSLKIFIFGIELCETNEIHLENKILEEYYNDIITNEYTWEELKEKYQPIYNSLHSKFKLVCN